MSRSITVTVSGATGQQGGALARLLLGRGHRVRALTRRPGSRPARDLRELGADVYEADLTDGDAVQEAAEGADSFFLMATPYEAGLEAEIRQACAAAEAAKVAEVKHLVYSSVASADQRTGVPHFDSKREVELYVQNLGVPYTIVGPVFFMENLLGPMFSDGLRGGTLSMPLPPDRPLQVIAVEDIARFVCLAMERPTEFQGRRIDIAADALTGPQMAKAIAATGRTVGYVQAPLDSVRSWSADLARMWEWFDQVGYRVDIEKLWGYPEVGWQDFRKWARRQDWSTVDQAGAEQPGA